ncbi:MAG: N-acetylmuramoyl-L-alanine amidase [Paenibacillus sp.]|nr:N-acetylmuramoyl-L-alanine amidase [Paenibacillus sp.]
MQIIQKGSKHTNFSGRGGHIPIAIVDHISGGTMASMDSWFTSPGNTVSSAHYGVSKAGEIHQYVDITKMAWCNGISIESMPKATAAIIQELAPINPNKYTVSIEHEGTDGTLTEAQFTATVWLHKHISDEVKRLYGKAIILDEKHVLGHFQVDPVRKPYCPGPKFPWSRLYDALKSKGEENVKKDDIVTVKLEGKKLTDGILDDGTTYIPVRALAGVLGATVTYDVATKTVNITK